MQRLSAVTHAQQRCSVRRTFVAATISVATPSLPPLTAASRSFNVRARGGPAGDGAVSGRHTRATNASGLGTRRIVSGGHGMGTGTEPGDRQAASLLRGARDANSALSYIKRRVGDVAGGQGLASEPAGSALGNNNGSSSSSSPSSSSSSTPAPNCSTEGADAVGSVPGPVERLYDEPSRPPPARIVKAFFIPGLDDVDEPASAKDAAQGREASKDAKSSSGTSTSTGKDGEKDKAKTTAAAATTAATKKEEEEAKLSAHAAEMEAEAALAAEESSGGGGDGASKSAVATGRATAQRISEATRQTYPAVVLIEKVRQNKRIKKLLMAALGSDFAHAGLHTDGVRTSFSVVNYQMLRQLTGLQRIPAKLLISCFPAPDRSFTWVDISAHPTATLAEYRDSLLEALEGLHIDRNLIECCQEPMQLPQVTVTKHCMCFLMRYAIEVPQDKRLDTFQDLTNRFTLFISGDRLVTVHRTQCAFLEELKVDWRDSAATHNSGRHGKRFMLYYCVKETLATFTKALTKCIVEFDRYEANLFATSHLRSSHAREIYHIKRRASVYGRTLTLTQDAYTHISSAMNVSINHVQYQEILHDLSHVESLAEELSANADSLLQLLFQLSSYQVNELMRVLTLFSAFFIPLSFIAGVFGMNFEHLPWISSSYGEVYCLVLMTIVSVSIFVWFKVNAFF